MIMIYDLSKLPKATQKEIQNNYSELFSKFPENLFSVNADTKTKKGKKLKVLTGIMYLAPYKLSGVNVCPMAELARCHEGCLNTAGRGQFTSNQMARLRKTLFYQQYPIEFKQLIRKELNRLIRQANKINFTPMVRLNGTSDVRWELFMPEIFKEYSHIQFYDYTKIPNRKLGNIQNYDDTFSYSGVKEYQPMVEKAIKNNKRIAVVFRSKENQPRTFMGMDCVNGDDTDVRPYDKQGVVVTLYAKGKARKDTSGFVVDN
tara:strand:- start:1478 stop:2257 length:780 start_codon:yes stop_codon:yes gene_type:complete